MILYLYHVQVILVDAFPKLTRTYILFHGNETGVFLAVIGKRYVYLILAAGLITHGTRA
jgi:hypothetical protein